jgi:hypothetical protein
MIAEKVGVWKFKKFQRAAIMCQLVPDVLRKARYYSYRRDEASCPEERG